MLRTNYKDDVFTGNRKYRMISNGDGTVSFEDVTEYSQVGDFYGAADVNELNDTVNNLGITVSDTPIPVAQRKDGGLYFFYS